MDSIAQWHRDFPGIVAGMVVSTGMAADRLAFTTALSAAGLPVHVEYVVGETTATTLRDIVRAAGTSPISVHLLGRSDSVDESLADVLSVRPERVILPWPAFTARRATAIRAADARAWLSVWKEWDGRRVPAGWATVPDGILVLLSEPGAPERCRIRQINVIGASTARHPAIPVAAAGGITEAVARLCLSAGAQYVIVGRALRPTRRASDSGGDRNVGTAGGV